MAREQLGVVDPALILRVSQALGTDVVEVAIGHLCSLFQPRPNRIEAVSRRPDEPTLFRQGWLYLAVVMDLYSRRIIGWAMDRHVGRHLVIEALTMALGHRQPTASLLHHSDRGPQYTSDDFRDLLDQHGIQCSMSARGHCYDNAPVESFFALLKREWIRRRVYATREEAKADVFAYIEVFYNRNRRHGTLGYVSPVAFEQEVLRA